MKPAAYSYLRMSTAEQIKGDSFRRQSEASRQYAEDNGLNLIEDYKLSDMGVSAFKGANMQEGAAFGKFLKAVNSGEIPKGSYLLIESLDRISRQHPMRAVGYFSDIVSSGITIVTIADGKKYDMSAAHSEFDLFGAMAVMVRAFEESKTKSVRLSGAWAEKRKQATEFKLTKMCPLWMTVSKDRKSFILFEDKAAIILSMFRSASEGKGSSLITKELNQAGIPPFGRSKVWVESYVTKILKNRAVLGEFQPHIRVDGKHVPHGDPIPGYFPAVITEDLFNLVRAGRRARGSGGGGVRGKNQTNLFAHVGRCGYCGGVMRHYNKGPMPKGGRWLVCLNGRNGSGCFSKGWRYESFEKSFLTYVKDIDMRSLVDGAKKKEGIADRRSRLLAASEKLQSAKELIRSYLLKIESNPDLEEFYTSRMLEIQIDIRATELDINTLRQEIDAQDASSGSNMSAEEMQAYIKIFQSGDSVNRFALADRIKQIIEKIELFVNGIEIEGVDHTLVSKGSIFALRPEFRVSFKSGATQVVSLNAGGSPESLHVSFISDGKSIEWDDGDVDA